MLSLQGKEFKVADVKAIKTERSHDGFTGGFGCAVFYIGGTLVAAGVGMAGMLQEAGWLWLAAIALVATVGGLAVTMRAGNEGRLFVLSLETPEGWVVAYRTNDGASAESVFEAVRDLIEDRLRFEGSTK